MKKMRVRLIPIVALLILMPIAPAMMGCEAIAAYLLYEWIQDEFGDGDGDEPDDPVIRSIRIDREEIRVGEDVILTVEATDNKDSPGELEYLWVVSAGNLLDPTNRITVWETPDEPGTVMISVVVTDTDDNQDTAAVQVDVLD